MKTIIVLMTSALIALIAFIMGIESICFISMSISWGACMLLIMQMYRDKVLSKESQE